MLKYKEVNEWNEQARQLVYDIESTLSDFTHLLSLENKENLKPRSSSLTVSNKADPLTIKHLIRSGINNLRQKKSPLSVQDSKKTRSLQPKKNSVSKKRKSSLRVKLC